MKRSRGLHADPFRIIYYCLLFLLFYFVILPVLSVILYGLFPLQPPVQFGRMVSRSLPFLANSLFVSGIVTVISTFVGLSAALSVYRFPGPFQRFFHHTFLLALIHPPFVGSLAFIMLFGKRGLITHEILHLSVSPYGWPGIIIMESLGLSALAYLIISSAIVKADPAMEDAARNLGASEIRIFFNITLKAMYPGDLHRGDPGFPLLYGGFRYTPGYRRGFSNLGIGSLYPDYRTL